MLNRLRSLPRRSHHGPECWSIGGQCVLCLYTKSLATIESYQPFLKGFEIARQPSSVGATNPMRDECAPQATALGRRINAEGQEIPVVTWRVLLTELPECCIELLRPLEALPAKAPGHHQKPNPRRRPSAKLGSWRQPDRTPSKRGGAINDARPLTKTEHTAEEPR